MRGGDAVADRPDSQCPQETHDDAGRDRRIALLGGSNRCRAEPQPLSEVGLRESPPATRSADELPEPNEVVGYWPGNLGQCAAPHRSPMYCLLSALKDNTLLPERVQSQGRDACQRAK